jgi:hypothetical protein
MSGRAFGLCLGGALALAQSLVARSVSATPVDLQIDCQGLSAELQASLEARSRAELSMKRLEGWHLQITCDGPRAAVEFTPAGGPVSVREGTLIGEPEDWVDRMLSLVHDAAAIDEAPPQPAGGANFPAAQERPEAATPIAEPVPPVEPPKQLATQLATQPDARPGGPSPRKADAVRFEPEMSVGVEVWTAEPLVLVGPAASLGIRLERRLRIVPTAAAAWSAGLDQNVFVRLIEGGVDAVLGDRWWLGLGGRVAWLRFEPRPALVPVTRTIVDPAFVLRAGLSIPVGNGRFSTSVGARTYLERRDVRVDGALTLRVPNVAATAGVGYAAELP